MKFLIALSNKHRSKNDQVDCFYLWDFNKNNILCATCLICKEIITSCDDYDYNANKTVYVHGKNHIKNSILKTFI